MCRGRERGLQPPSLRSLNESAASRTMGISFGERLANVSLPMSARTNPSYWTALARRVQWWRQSGWRDRLDREAEAVAFTRNHGNP